MENGSGRASLHAHAGLGVLQLGLDQLLQLPDGLVGKKPDERQLIGLG